MFTAICDGASTMESNLERTWEVLPTKYRANLLSQEKDRWWKMGWSLWPWCGSCAIAKLELHSFPPLLRGMKLGNVPRSCIPGSCLAAVVAIATRSSLKKISFSRYVLVPNRGPPAPSSGIFQAREKEPLYMMPATLPTDPEGRHGWECKNLLRCPAPSCIQPAEQVNYQGHRGWLHPSLKPDWKDILELGCRPLLNHFSQKGLRLTRTSPI